ncbi:hypothetical protein [Segatella copri]|uniref:Uncharacterized protein n=1 Tax=Segatella copri TaxID=165179 RepID=A0A414YGB3_9BACT|nr:hypothetical protein [Segatella copri]RHH85171.1 hypothetical protein DW192_00115 [Segatella copri]
MDKLEYIPGDLVKFVTNTYTIVNFEENFLHNKICYALISTNSTKTALVADRDILPIPLTTEILEKNSHWVYTKPDIEEYGYFPIYIEKGIGDEFDVYPFTDNNVCKQIAYIKYVHELQHLLFGLGINHKMEV